MEGDSAFSILYNYRTDVHTVMNGGTPSATYNDEITNNIISHLRDNGRSGLSYINYCFLLGAPGTPVIMASDEHPGALKENEIAFICNLLHSRGYTP